jgi:hypothetical protein
MRIYQHLDLDGVAPSRIGLRAASGYLITEGSPRLALHCASPQNVALAATTIDAVDTGLTLDEAHTALTDGLTKAELVALGDDFGLILSDSSLKAELLADIRAHLEGLS